MFICPECRSITEELGDGRCERDQAPLAEVLAHQTKARYPLLGKVIGDRYHLIGGLGQGGLGTVYLARHLHLDQLFAVKFLELDVLGAQTGDASVDGYRRDFLKEARVASLIRHESVVRVSDFGEFDGSPYLVMDYVPGPSLLQLLGEKGRFDVSEAINIARRIAEALEAFHERRLVHRDLKPANVILDPRGDGRLTLVDLGLVKDVSGPGGRASTHPMALRGTPGYLAPEQVPSWVLSGVGVEREKQPVDARVDLYALGVIFYEMLAGVSPYPDGTNTAIIIYACTKPPIPFGRVEPPPNLLPGLEELVMDTMHQDPERRPQSASEFLERLEEVALRPAFVGSWPSIAVGRRRNMDISQPLAANALVAPPPESSAVEAPATEPSSEDQTMEADADSFDGALDRADEGGFEDASVTHIQDVESLRAQPAGSAAVAAAPTTQDAPRRGTPAWIWALLAGVLLGAGVALWMASDDSPRPGDGPVRVTLPPLPVPDATVVAVIPTGPSEKQPVRADPDAGAQAAPDAAPALDAAKPDASKKAAAKPKRRWRPRKPKKPKAPAAASDPAALFAAAETAQRAGKLAEALRIYKRYQAVADRRHPQFSTVASRIKFLEGKVAQR